MQSGWALGLLSSRPGPRGRRLTASISGWDLFDAIAMCTATPRDGRLANSTFDRTGNLPRKSRHFYSRAHSFSRLRGYHGSASLNTTGDLLGWRALRLCDGCRARSLPCASLIPGVDLPDPPGRLIRSVKR